MTRVLFSWRSSKVNSSSQNPLYGCCYIHVPKVKGNRHGQKALFVNHHVVKEIQLSRIKKKKIGDSVFLFYFFSSTDLRPKLTLHRLETPCSCVNQKLIFGSFCETLSAEQSYGIKSPKLLFHAESSLDSKRKMKTSCNSNNRKKTLNSKFFIHFFSTFTSWQPTKRKGYISEIN